jgi:hypothetical protein
VLLDLAEPEVLSANEIRRLHGSGSGTFRPILNDRPDNISATASQQHCQDLLSIGRASHAESRKRSARVACSKVARCHQALPTAGDLAIRMDGAEGWSNFMMNSGATALDQA